MSHENTTRPTPPNLSEGCFNCGGSKNEILHSLLRNSASVALCSPCEKLDPRQLSTQPHGARGGAR